MKMGEILRKLQVKCRKCYNKPFATTHRFKRLNSSETQREEKTTFTTSRYVFEVMHAMYH